MTLVVIWQLWTLFRKRHTHPTACMRCVAFLLSLPGGDGVCNGLGQKNRQDPRQTCDPLLASMTAIRVESSWIRLVQLLRRLRL